MPWAAFLKDVFSSGLAMLGAKERLPPLFDGKRDFCIGRFFRDFSNCMLF